MERIVVQFVVDVDEDDVYSLGSKSWWGKTIDCNAAYRFPYGNPPSLPKTDMKR